LWQTQGQQLWYRAGITSRGKKTNASGGLERSPRASYKDWVWDDEIGEETSETALGITALQTQLRRAGSFLRTV